MDLIDSDLGFDLREGVPVAIVIVPGVLVVNRRRLAAFVRCAQRLVVPVLHNVHAIGIQRWHQQDDRVLEYLLDLRFVR